MQRERLGSRLGFILLSAGCAIGVGNVWKFPLAGRQYGGGAFVCLLYYFPAHPRPSDHDDGICGWPCQPEEPGTRLSGAGKPGTKWHIHGYIALIGNYLLMMFYTTVCGWMLYYFLPDGRRPV